MLSLFFFVLVPAFAVFLLPFGLETLVGTPSTLSLATQLGSVATLHLVMIWYMRNAATSCRLAYTRAHDILGGLNPNNLCKGRDRLRAAVKLHLRAAHCAHRFPIYLAVSSLIYAIVALVIWQLGYLSHDMLARATIVALSFLLSAMLLRIASNSVLRALHEVDADFGCDP